MVSDEQPRQYAEANTVVGLRVEPAEPATADSNPSDIHDFVVGSREPDATGLPADGTAEPLLSGGEWPSGGAAS